MENVSIPPIDGDVDKHVQYLLGSALVQHGDGQTTTSMGTGASRSNKDMISGSKRKETGQGEFDNAKLNSENAQAVQQPPRENKGKVQQEKNANGRKKLSFDNGLQQLDVLPEIASADPTFAGNDNAPRRKIKLQQVKKGGAKQMMSVDVQGEKEKEAVDVSTYALESTKNHGTQDPTRTTEVGSGARSTRTPITLSTGQEKVTEESPSNNDHMQQLEGDQMFDDLFMDEEYPLSEDDNNVWDNYVDMGLEGFDLGYVDNITQSPSDHNGPSESMLQQNNEPARDGLAADDMDNESMQPELRTELVAVQDGPSNSAPRKRKQYLNNDADEMDLFAGEDMNAGEESDDSMDTDKEYNTNSSSEEDEGDVGVKKRKFDKHIPVQGLNDPEFKLGLIFSTKSELKAAIIQHAIKWGRPMKFVKNDNKRIRAVCGGANCNWLLYAAKMSRTASFQIKTLQEKHKCGRTFYHRGASHKWLAMNYLDDFKSNKSFDAGKFQDKIHKELNVNITRNVVYKAKRAARLMIEGKYRDQYRKLQDYCEELRITNPGSTVILETLEDEDTTEPTFRRLYICFEAVKRGFLQGCRKLIGLDGCFLKGPHPGILLTAVGIDANNGFYPVAYCVDGRENKENWKWFLENLIQDLNIDDQEDWALISDRQKGLIPAVCELLPRVEHRFCVRHFHNNFKKEHPGEALRLRLWNCAKSTYENKFNAEFESLKEFDEEAWQWLIENDSPRHWSRAYFRCNIKCDVLLNNHCESFNSKIIEAREKPILGMLERIRVFMMTRLKIKRDWMMKQDSTICPRIIKTLEKLKEDSRLQVVCFAGESICQVTHNSTLEQFVVDLALRVCSCRKWELSGIPCVHAIAAIGFIGKDPADFVHYCYSREAFLRAYTPIINPINGPNNWPRTDKPTILAPPKLKLPGRPKKARIKEQGEPAKRSGGITKLSKKGLGTGRCRKCGNKGHNKRTCPQHNHNKVHEQNGTTECQEDLDLVNGANSVNLGNSNKCSLCGETGHNRRLCQSEGQHIWQGNYGCTLESPNTQVSVVIDAIIPPKIIPNQSSQVDTGNDDIIARKLVMKCSICRQVGHNKKKCPSTQGQDIRNFREYLLRG